jgi:UDP-3-O-[3-hydroxymyristoyl] glucosamine N-acyltransferase
LGWNVDSLLKELDIDYSYEKSENQDVPITVNGIAPINNAYPQDLAFCSSEGDEAVMSISRSGAGVIFCKKSVELFLSPMQKKKQQQCLIFLENPRLTVMRIIKLIYKEQKKESIGVSPKAVVSKTAKIGENCSVGEYSVIGNNCEIGDNTTIYDRVSILQNTRIGRNCIIQPGVVIGADGFAYERHPETMELERFPHIGGVDIRDNVEICSNCSIARGSLSNTIIGNGTKLDALVHVAHNVEIGKNCALTGGVIIGGSTIIGDTCWFGLNSTLKHKIKIGNKVIVGSGASVIGNIEDEDIVAGVPAKSIKAKVRSNQLFLMGGQTSRRKSKDIVSLSEPLKTA